MSNAGADKADLEPSHPGGAVFRLAGDCWTIAHGERVFGLRDSIGLRYLAHLLRRPGVHVHAADLVAHATGRGPAAGATESNASDTERARVRVTHAIRHTLRRIALHHPELHEHLCATIKTGSRCAYLPHPHRRVHCELGMSEGRGEP